MRWGKVCERAKHSKQQLKLTRLVRDGGQRIEGGAVQLAAAHTHTLHGGNTVTHTAVCTRRCGRGSWFRRNKRAPFLLKRSGSITKTGRCFVQILNMPRRKVCVSASVFMVSVVLRLAPLL